MAASPPALSPTLPPASRPYTHDVVSLQDLLLQTCKISLSNKPLVSLSLTLGNFFGLEAGQLKGLQACRVQPNNW